jgi:hypothetical protein
VDHVVSFMMSVRYILVYVGLLFCRWQGVVGVSGFEFGIGAVDMHTVSYHARAQFRVSQGYLVSEGDLLEVGIYLKLSQVRANSYGRAIVC